MRKKEILNGIEYHFDGTKFANAAEYVASVSGIEFYTTEDSQHVLKSLTVAGKTWRNVPRSGAVNYGLTLDEFDSAYTEQQNAELFESEKCIALQIIADYQLGLHSITEQDITDTRLYIQSIEPLSVASNQRAAMPRPQIFSRYKDNPYEL